MLHANDSHLQLTHVKQNVEKQRFGNKAPPALTLIEMGTLSIPLHPVPIY